MSDKEDVINDYLKLICKNNVLCQHEFETIEDFRDRYLEYLDRNNYSNKSKES